MPLKWSRRGAGSTTDIDAAPAAAAVPAAPAPVVAVAAPVPHRSDIGFPKCLRRWGTRN